MSEQNSKPDARPAATDHHIAPTLWRIVLRLYALCILLIVVWTGYTAVAYLVRTVFMPASVPPRFVERVEPLTVQTRPAAEVSAVPGADWPVQRIALEPREVDPGHYHQASLSLPPDPLNGCLTSGCHTPLPHMRDKASRAFANFHTTFLDCRMCHQQPEQTPVKAAWFDLNQGTVRDSPPGLIALQKLLDTRAEAIQSQPADVHAELLGLLDAVLAVIDDPTLRHLRVQINTSEPGSPMWRHSVARLVSDLPAHARGEYGARLIMEDADAHRQRSERLRDAAARYFAAGKDSPQREQISRDIHAGVLAKPDACLSCHGSDTPRLDLEQVGYSAQRAAALQASPIARMIQQIRQGQPFYLPNLLEGGGQP